MKFKNIGRRPHDMADGSRVQPGETVETEFDLATSFPDKFRSLVEVEIPARTTEAPESSTSGLGPVPSTPDVVQAKEAAPKRRGRRSA